MEFVEGESLIDYKVIKDATTASEEIKQLFTRGEATEVIEINAIKITDGSIATLTGVLQKFCESLKGKVIAYSLNSTDSPVSSTVTRYALQSVGFKSFAKFVDDVDATVFLYENAQSNAIFTRMFDEFIGYELHDVACYLREKDTSRAENILAVLEPGDVTTLAEYIASVESKGAVPKKMQF